MGLPFQGFLQAYLTTRMYAVETDVGTTSWVHSASGVPQGGAEGSFLFLLVALPLAFYIRRTYPDVAPYPLRRTLLAFEDDMAVVIATARQPQSTTPDPTRAIKVIRAVTNYLEGNQLLVHNVKSATMVHNETPPALRPGDPPVNPVSKATYLGVQQGASANGVTLPPNLIRQLTRTLVIAGIVALSCQALAYFLQAVLNAAIGFQALHLTHPQHMLQVATTTVRRARTIHGHQPTSLPAAVRAVSPPYYGNNTDHLVNNAYTAHTAAHPHGLMHNHEPEVRKVFTLTLREAQYHRNTCPQYILHQRGLPNKVGTRVWNHLQLLLPQHQHDIQKNHQCRETGPVAFLHTDVAGGPTGSTTTVDLVGTTLHLIRVSPNEMRALQRVGTHHVPFLQHPEWPNMSVLASHMRNAATQTGHPQPIDGEVHEAYNLFWSTHKRPLPPGPPRGNWAHHWPPEQVDYVPGATVPEVLLLAPNRLKTTLRQGRAHGNLWMLPPPTALPFCQPPLSQDKLTGTPTTCWRCGPRALPPPPVARATTTGALPPYTNSPHNPRTTPVATHALGTRCGEGHGHSGVGPGRRGGMEIPPGNVRPQTPSRHLPGAGQTPQRHIGVSRLPGTTPLLPTPGLADGRVDHIPPTESVPAPMCVRLPHTRPRGEQQLWECMLSEYSNRPPPRRGPPRTGSNRARLTAYDAVPPTMPGRPQRRHFCGCLWHHKPHPSSWAGSFGVEDGRDRPSAPTPPHRGHHLRGLLSRGTENTGGHCGRRQLHPPATT